MQERTSSCSQQCPVVYQDRTTLEWLPLLRMHSRRTMQQVCSRRHLLAPKAVLLPHSREPQIQPKCIDPYGSIEVSSRISVPSCSVLSSSCKFVHLHVIVQTHAAYRAHSLSGTTAPGRKSLHSGGGESSTLRFHLCCHLHAHTRHELFCIGRITTCALSCTLPSVICCC